MVPRAWATGSSPSKTHTYPTPSGVALRTAGRAAPGETERAERASSFAPGAGFCWGASCVRLPFARAGEKYRRGVGGVVVMSLASP